MITVEERLGRYRTELDRAADETTSFAPTRPEPAPAWGGRGWVATAAAIVLVAGLAAVLVGRDGGTPLRPVQPPPALVPGAYTFDDTPDGLLLTRAEIAPSPLRFDASQLVRLYATDTADPLAGPWLRIMRLGPTVRTIIPPEATPVTVDGHPAQRWRNGDVDRIAVDRGEFWLDLAMRGVDDPLAIAASAEVTSPDGGPVVDNGLLPDGVTDRGLGKVEEVRFVPLASIDVPSISIGWTAADRTHGVFIRSYPETAAEFALNPIAFDFAAVTDTFAGGRPVRMTTVDGTVSIEWNVDGMTTVMGLYRSGEQPTTGEALALAGRLRQMTEDEWSAMQLPLTYETSAEDSTPVGTMALPTASATVGPKVAGHQTVVHNADGSASFRFEADGITSRPLDVTVEGDICTIRDGETLVLRGSIGRPGDNAMNLIPLDTTTDGARLVARGVLVETTDPRADLLTAVGTDGTEYTTDIATVPGQDLQRFAFITLPVGSLASATVTDADGTVLARL